MLRSWSAPAHRRSGLDDLLATAETVQSAQRHLVPVAVDAVLAVAAVACYEGVGREAGTFGATLVVAGLACGLWKRRTPVESQGVGWYLRPLVPSVVATDVAARLLLGRSWDLAATRPVLAVTTVAGVLLALRWLLWLIVGASRRRGRALHPTLVVGPPAAVAEVCTRLRTYPEAGLVPVATHTPPLRAPGSHRPGRLAVDRLLGEGPAEHAVCVVDECSDPLVRELIRFAEGRVDCSLVLPLGGLAAGRSRVHLGDYGLLPIQLKTSWGSNGAKRVLDAVVAAVLLLLLSPLLAAIAVAVRLGDPGPAVFRQVRVGISGRRFTCYKFRSMIVDAEARRDEHAGANVGAGLLFKVEADPRITKVGSLIRRMSFDELPQLYNVLIGDMSLVGPRPLPVEPDEFDVRAEIRHIVRPGITGLWQVLGANALDYDAMVDLDLTYVTSHSLGGDLTILARTVPAVLVRRAAY